MYPDPVDIFGETIGEPIKRVAIYFLGIFVGSWVGKIALNIDRGHWLLLDWDDFTSGFLCPLAILFSSAGPLLVLGLLYFVLTSWRLDWSWFPVVAGSSAFVITDHEAELGWIAWAILNTGIAGAIWLRAAYHRTRWTLELAELNAFNSMQRSIREKEKEIEETDTE